MLDPLEIQSLVGASEELTDKILYRVKTLPPSKAFLPTYSLLLIERFESAVGLVAKTMEEELDLQFLSYLQNSKFYLQRMAVPVAILSLTFPEKKVFLKNALKDPICDVVKQAVQSVKIDNPFDNEELLEIALELFRSRYTAVKILTVDVLVMIKECTFMLANLINSTNWRVRLKVASRISDFCPEDQERILIELKKDHIEEVRTELSKNIRSLMHLDLLQDPCEHVRSNYLSNILDQITDEEMLKRLVEDSSWQVKKVLLNLKGDMFKKVTIPLIRNSTENVSWRIKYDILCLIEERIENEFASKLLMNFLIKNMRDKVNEIRTKTQQILVRIIIQYRWACEYFYEIENLASSPNYLHRISAIPVVIEYDLKHKTAIGKRLRDDGVVNVRECFVECAKGRIEYDQNYEIDPEMSFVEP